MRGEGARTPRDPVEGMTHIVVRRPAVSSPARLAWAVRAARTWLGSETRPAPDGMHRYQADLRLRVSDHPSVVTFGKAAFVDLGSIKWRKDAWEAEVSWRAATLAPLFPVFSGAIAVSEGEVTVAGWYAPPGGALGRLADRALLHLAAEGTARWLLAELERVAADGVY